MTDHPKPGTVAWLRENADFECEGCPHSLPYDRLRVFDGFPYCVDGYEKLVTSVYEGCAPTWLDLQPFDPFARLEEAARLLRELVRETAIERVEGLPWLNAQIDPELWAEVEKWSEEP